MLSVIQFSDLHVAPQGYRGYGGFGPDTGRTWTAATSQALSPDVPSPDRLVITGDIAEHGSAEEYRIAADRFVELDVPTNVITGNHDFQITAEAFLASRMISMNRAERHGPWLFIYIDSNSTESTRDGAPFGPSFFEAADRIDGNGGVDRGEIARVQRTLAVSDADHVWLWMHHTPNATGVFANTQFTEAVADLVRSDDRIRGISSGHVHNNSTAEVAGVPVYICPSLTLNVDVDTWRTLPPGYREYTFANDGAAVSELVWVEMDDFEPFELPEETIAHLQGKMTFEEMVRELNEKR